MMNKHLELIWKKIDGNITQQEQESFDLLYKSKDEFKNLYKEQLRLNNALRQMPLQKAPEALLKNVMKAVSAEAAYKLNMASFSGIKTIALIFGGLTLSICILFIMSNGIHLSSGNSGVLGSAIHDITSRLIIPDEFYKYINYTLIPIAATVLFWIDNYLKRNRLAYTAML